MTNYRSFCVPSNSVEKSCNRRYGAEICLEDTMSCFASHLRIWRQQTVCNPSCLLDSLMQVPILYCRCYRMLGYMCNNRWQRIE